MIFQKKIFYRIVFIFPIIIGCNSQKIFLNSGDIYDTSYYNYCNDSLKIYSKLMGDFDKNMFFKQKISAETKRVLRNISFNQKEDKILFHSITTIEPYYNVIGSLRKNIDFNPLGVIKLFDF